MSLLGLSTAGHWGESGGSGTVINLTLPLKGVVENKSLIGLIESSDLKGLINTTDEIEIIDATSGFPTMWGTWGAEV